MPTTAVSRRCARAIGPPSTPRSPTIWCTFTARQESKAEHIANLRAGQPRYRGIAPRERRARVHGGVGLVHGVSDMQVERDGKENRFTVRYLAVYAKAGEHWRMIAWQSTRQD